MNEFIDRIGSTHRGKNCKRKMSNKLVDKHCFRSIGNYKWTSNDGLKNRKAQDYTKQLSMCWSNCTWLIVLTLLFTVPCWGMRVGPRLDESSSLEAQGINDSPEVLKQRLNIPSMRLAIPVLNPGIPESTLDQENAGIWPELRKAEAVRSAFKLKDWMHRYNQFDSIVVSADVSVSADLYLIARIVKSDSETMKLAYRIVDARGVFWTDERVKEHRTEIGWQNRYGSTEKDPFDPLYDKIALDLYNELIMKSELHANQLKRNEFVGPRLARLTDLERITFTRDLAFARYLSPEYEDTLKEVGDRLELEYIPENWSKNWVRISSIMTREEDFVQVIEQYYEKFIAKVEPDYKTWQRDTFPVARKLRTAWDKREALVEINNLGKRLHTTIEPTRIELNGKVTTLTGSVQSQFGEWRSMLADIYASADDSDSVKILQNDQ